MGDFKQRRLAAAPRVLHPSADLSELPPLRSVVARQAYHYRLAGSSQNSLPKLLPAGWDRSSPYWAVFIQQSCTGGLRASAKSLFPRRVLPTDVLLNRIFFFQRTTKVNVPLFNPTDFCVLSGVPTKKSPHCIGHGNAIFTSSFEIIHRSFTFPRLRCLFEPLRKSLSCGRQRERTF